MESNPPLSRSSISPRGSKWQIKCDSQRRFQRGAINRPDYHLFPTGRSSRGSSREFVTPTRRWPADNTTGYARRLLFMQRKKRDRSIRDGAPEDNWPRRIFLDALEISRYDLRIRNQSACGFASVFRFAGTCYDIFFMWCIA